MFEIYFPYNFSVIPQFFSRFIFAAWMTMQITTLGIVLGLILGLVIALMRISPIKILNAPAKAYIWAIRGTPLLLQLLIIYNGMAPIMRIERYPAAVIALGIHNAAYLAEIFRGAIQSIDRGQREAAMSLGMTSWQAMKRIILPQAFKRAVPPLGNQFIIALKDSSLASVIAVPELLSRARQFGSSNFLYMEMLVIAGIYYLIMTSVLTVVVNHVEERLRVSEYRA
ncbi:amino acid ABC transporter permease [Dethiobacter alkaliphilus]|uniref:Polar amino acid ABC transporter, inner membrane subunit n=1 Tax=Dethiobacter alkaliphilus AHT 1 TaxID=555088 RepID=C0GGZ8_DETAL|nr:amino acid ABC transporter permease [Dethiobacter alkaliphilus]EEG77300.1 polar amino acid ABC transporter, inner membrane subunit [Dethiobacter alkaliphilus AHT 1]